MCEKLKSGPRKQNFFFKKLFLKNFGFNEKFKNKSEKINEKYAVDSAIKFPIKSILRPSVITKTIRQRMS